MAAIRGALAARAAWLIPALTLVALWPLLWSDGHHLGDHFTFWYVGRLLAEGRSPYDPAAWADALAYGAEPGGVAVSLAARQIALGDAGWLYPPWTGFAFVPFGALPVEIGTGALHLTVLLSSVVGVAALAALLPFRSAVVRGVATSALFAAYPLVLGVRSGHLAGVLIVGLAVLAHGVFRGHAAMVVAGAVILAMKPHVVALVTVATLALLVRRRAWRTIAATAAVLAVAAVATVVRHPESVTILASGGAESLGALDYYSSTWSFAAHLAGGAGPALALGLIGIAAIAGAVAVRRAQQGGPWTAAAAICVLSAALPPYLGAYDHLVALAPATLIAALGIDGRPRRALGLAALVVAVVVMTWALLIASLAVGNWLPGVVPALTAALLLLGPRDRSPLATARA